MAAGGTSGRGDMGVRGVRVEQIACGECPIGRASGAGHGLFCPFITRRYEEGAPICRAGEPIEYVWFVKTGVVGVNHSTSADGSDDAESLAMPGSFIGVEYLIGDRRIVAARALTAATLCGASVYGFTQWLESAPERSQLIMDAVLVDPMLVEHARLFAARLSRPPEWGPDESGPQRRRR